MCNEFSSFFFKSGRKCYFSNSTFINHSIYVHWMSCFFFINLKTNKKSFFPHKNLNEEHAGLRFGSKFSNFKSVCRRLSWNFWGFHTYFVEYVSSKASAVIWLLFFTNLLETDRLPLFYSHFLLYSTDYWKLWRKTCPTIICYSQQLKCLFLNTISI